MTRSFHQAVRLIPRRPKREPRPATLSFTCYRLVRIFDQLPGEAPYAAVQVVDPANAMRVLVFKR
jgi:hypothetical protein